MSRPSLDQVRREIIERLASALDLSVDRIDPTAAFATYGLASRDAIVLSGDLAEWLGTPVQPTVFYDYPSVNALADYITTLSAPLSSPEASPITAGEPIVIVGIGCRFPGAHGPAEFLRLLEEGADLVTRMPAPRQALLGDGALDAIPEHGQWGGFVEDVDAFDAPFFGIGAAEAASMDPQQRWLLEVAWEALEDAGLPPDDLAGSRTGVFVGLSTSDYALLRLRRTAGLDTYFGTSNSPSVAAGRIAYQLGLQGPTMAIDTACSSSLVAIHLACQSLRLQECGLALAGGVNLMLAPETTAWACRGRLLSESGRCRTFDRRADGYVRGEGCGLVVLKRLADAEAARDRIVAVIRGSAVNHDGRSSGLTAPNGLAQQRVIVEALAQARVAPEAVAYLEAHGTGTVLGDPIEMHAAGRVFCAQRAGDHPLVVGSVKTNVGHLEAAAGVAGLIKTALALTAERIPRHLHLDELNPYIASEQLPISIAAADSRWPAGRRLAGVSAFGLSGTNAHVILEAAPAADAVASPAAPGMLLLPISARSASALQAHVAAMRDRVLADEAGAAAVCYTASARRSHHRHRLAVWGPDAPALARALSSWLDGQAVEGVAAGVVSTSAEGGDVSAHAPLSAAGARELAESYCRGARVNWGRLYPAPAPPVALPRYPFDRHRYWLQTEDSSIATRLGRAPAGEQPTIVRDHLIGVVARCLDAPDGAAPAASTPLSALGLDSLGAIDLSNAIATDLGITVSPLALLDGMTIESVVDLALAQRGSAGREPLPQAAAAGAAFSLSQSQERIWILDRLAGAQAAYIIPSAVRIRGPLDARRLERALAATVARHPALRMRIRMIEERPMQETVASVAVPLRVVDLAELPPERRYEEALRRASDEVPLPFDLSQAPLFRTTMYRLDAEDHLWCIGIHHIVADGTSLAILMRDVLGAYEVDGDPPGPAPRAAYSQFVAWEQRRQDSAEVTALEAAAADLLAGARPLNLPTDRPRRADRSVAGSSAPLRVPADLVARLRALARRLDTTLNTLLTAAFQTLLGRLAQQSDVALGMPLVNRSRPEFEGVVGCFANTGVIRSDVSGERRFSDVVRDVHAGVREAWAREDLPFGRLVKTLGWREPGRNPFFDALFVLNVPTPPAVAAGATFEPVFLETRAAKFDLALFCEDRPDGLDGFLEYRHDLFDQATAERLLRRYVALLGSVAQDADRIVADLPFLDGDDLQVIERFADTPRTDFSRHACVHDLIRERAMLLPDAVAAVDDRQTVTYQVLERRASDVARSLTAMGIRRGALVAVAMRRSVDLLITLLGVLKSGAAYLPLDPELPQERILAIVADAGALLLDSVPRGDTDCAAAERGFRSPVSAADLAYVIYTSGSTGRPKGVEVTHRNAVNLLESMAQRPGMQAHDVLLSVTPVTFDIAALELFLPLVVGGRVVIAARETASDGGRLRDAIAATGPTILQATPATWRMLASAGYVPGTGLKVLCGGEALPADLAIHLTSAGAEVWNMYGPTETTIWSTTAPVRSDRAPSLGAPIANTSILVLDQRLRPVPIGSPGEVCIGGEGVARGYRGQPALTAAKFVPAPGRGDGARLYRTGDVGCLRADATLQYLGRSDDQIKIRGFRVEPAEIEAALAACPGVRQTAVIPHRAGQDDVRLVAFVSTDQPDGGADQYRRQIAARLPGYMMPSAFVRVDAFPLTPNGKINRQALSGAAAEAVGAAPLRHEPPRTPLERELAAIWAQVLGMPEVGVATSFFELGGHSLLAATVIARVESAYRVTLPLNLFYTAPSVAEHAGFIERQLAASQAPTPEEFDRLLSMIEGLSDEEAAAYLRSLDGAQHGEEL